MLLYDVTYPHSRDLDRDVPWTYCRDLASNPKNEGARATCINGEPHVYVLRGGQWVIVGLVERLAPVTAESPR